MLHHVAIKSYYYKYIILPHVVSVRCTSTKSFWVVWPHPKLPAFVDTMDTWCCYDLMFWWWFHIDRYGLNMLKHRKKNLIMMMFDQWYDVWSIRPYLFTLSYLDILHLYILALDSGVYCRIWQIEIFGFCVAKLNLHLQPRKDCFTFGLTWWCAWLDCKSWKTRESQRLPRCSLWGSPLPFCSNRQSWSYRLIIYHVSYIVIIIMRSIDCPSTTRLIIRRTGVGFHCVLLMTLALMIMNDPNIHHVHPFIFERPPPHFDFRVFCTDHVHIVHLLYSAIAFRSPWKPPKRLAVSTPSMPRVGRHCHVHCPPRVQGTHGNM